MQNKNIALIEDHHEALGIWRKKGFKGLPLVHLDAHIDFGFYPAKPIEKIFNEAKNLKELKQGLEYSLAFLHYEKDLDKQANIGNYIYPAMEDGIVRDFYWVVPGGLKEFKKSDRFIKNILNGILRQDFSRFGHTSHVTRHTSHVTRQKPEARSQKKRRDNLD